MPDIHYRAGTEADISPAAELFLESLTDLTKRFNLTMPSFESTAWVPGYRHVLETGIFRVAEVDGKLAAHCLAIVRDDLWFLSAFWARPAIQQQKVGQPLLKQVMDEGREQGARVFSVWSTIDPGSVACYMKQGMLPGYQMLAFTGTPSGIPELPKNYEAADLQSDVAQHLDQEVRGTARPMDHAYFAGDGEVKSVARQILFKDRPVGYFYYHCNMIGPAAWLADEHANAVLTAALRECSAKHESIRLVIPGINHDAIRLALKCGLRLSITPHFLTTAPFGHLDRYVVSGPTLF